MCVPQSYSHRRVDVHIADMNLVILFEFLLHVSDQPLSLNTRFANNVTSTSPLAHYSFRFDAHSNDFLGTVIISEPLNDVETRLTPEKRFFYLQRCFQRKDLTNRARENRLLTYGCKQIYKRWTPWFSRSERSPLLLSFTRTSWQTQDDWNHSSEVKLKHPGWGSPSTPGRQPTLQLVRRPF